MGSCCPRPRHQPLPRRLACDRADGDGLLLRDVRLPALLWGGLPRLWRRGHRRAAARRVCPDGDRDLPRGLPAGCSPRRGGVRRRLAPYAPAGSCPGECTPAGIGGGRIRAIDFVESLPQWPHAKCDGRNVRSMSTTRCKRREAAKGSVHPFTEFRVLRGFA